MRLERQMGCVRVKLPTRPRWESEASSLELQKGRQVLSLATTSQSLASACEMKRIGVVLNYSNIEIHLILASSAYVAGTIRK